MGTGPVDLAELTRRGLIRPASATRRTVTIDQMAPVEPLLAPLLRQPGLVPGDVLAVADRPGGRHLLLALAAAASRAGNWIGIIGMPVGLILAGEAMGIAADRTAFVPAPGPDPLSIVDVMASGLAVVIAAGLGRVPAARAGRLTQRLRDYRAVLLVHGDGWPRPTAALSTETVAWEGITGPGRGRLRSRTLAIEARVHGDPRPRRATVLLPDRAGRLAAARAESAGRPLAPSPAVEQAG